MYVLPVAYPEIGGITHVVIAVQMKKHLDSLSAFYDHFGRRSERTTARIRAVKQRVGENPLDRTAIMASDAMRQFLKDKLLIDVLFTPNDIQSALNTKALKAQQDLESKRGDICGMRESVAARRKQLQTLSKQGEKVPRGAQNARRRQISIPSNPPGDREETRIALEDEESMLDDVEKYISHGYVRVPVLDKSYREVIIRFPSLHETVLVPPEAFVCRPWGDSRVKRSHHEVVISGDDIRCFSPTVSYNTCEARVLS